MAAMHTSVTSPDAPAAIGPYSQAIRHGGLLWCSGQLGLDPQSGAMREGTAAQAEQALRNLDAICREAGTALVKAVRLTVYLVDLQEFAAVNALYEGFFEAPFPARATVQVAALPKGGRVEIDAVVAL
jgi:2-iminobutanoate/2-iminopropanoate deaminase